MSKSELKNVLKKRRKNKRIYSDYAVKIFKSNINNIDNTEKNEYY